MKKFILISLIHLLVLQSFLLASEGIKISMLQGMVKVRKGLSEVWQTADKNMVLDDMDTILSGENAVVRLVLPGENIFTLEENAILDISDLKTVSDKELLFYLMSEKIDRLEPHQGSTPLRIGNVSVVHGEDKADLPAGTGSENRDLILLQEKNGAISLMNNKLYANAIIKFHKIKSKYPQMEDCGEINFYLGRSFESINKPGLALDCYRKSLQETSGESCTNPGLQKQIQESRLAIKRLLK